MTEYKDSGYRPPNQGFGPFEAFSIKPNGDYLRTFHRSEKLAQRRLLGNPRHKGHKMIDHRPIIEGKRSWVWLDETGRAMRPKGGEL